MARLGRSYTIPIVIKGTDGLMPAGPAPVVINGRTPKITGAVVAQQGTAGLMPAGPTPVVINGSTPKIMGAVVAQQGTTGAVTTPPAQAVVVNGRTPAPRPLVLLSAAAVDLFDSIPLIAPAIPRPITKYTTFVLRNLIEIFPDEQPHNYIVKRPPFPRRFTTRIVTAPLVQPAAPAGPDAPLICGLTGVFGMDRDTGMSGARRTTAVAGFTRTSRTGGTSRSSGTGGTGRNSGTGPLTTRNTNTRGTSRISDIEDPC